MRINFAPLNFQVPAGAVGCRLSIQPVGATPTPNSVYDGPKAEVGIDGIVDSAEIVGLAGPGIEGRFDLYLWAYDAAGNESDFGIKRDVPLDLVAPAAPSWL